MEFEVLFLGSQESAICLILRYVNPFHFLLASFFKVYLRLSSHPCSDLLSGFFSARPTIKHCLKFCFDSHTSHPPPVSFSLVWLLHTLLKSTNHDVCHCSIFHILLLLLASWAQIPSLFSKNCSLYFSNFLHTNNIRNFSNESTFAFVRRSQRCCS